MAGSSSGVEKIAWAGRLVGVQPRIRLLRSFDERQHSYQGYVLRVNGTCGTEAGEFLVAVGPGAHKKCQFRTGMELSGQAVPADDPRLEAAGFYKTSGLKVVKVPEGEPPAGPPRVLAYNSPFMPFWMKYAEVQIPVRATAKGSPPASER